MAGKPNRRMPSLDPMLATLIPEPFDDDEWFFEPKWDGVRAAAVCTDETRLISRNRKDITVAYPELATIHEQVKAGDAILDGEIITFDDGVPSFEKLQSRMHVRGPAEIQRLMKLIPVAYVVFDVLYLGGRDVTGLPYTERRALLESNLQTTSWLQLSPAVPTTGIAMFEAARQQNLEGIVAKRGSSVYEHGRSKSWLKIKTTYEGDLVIAGWSEGGGGHNGVLGSIVTATYDDGALRYNGSVGTGFSDKSRRLTQERLEALAVKDCPFPAETLKGKRELRFAHWVRPKLVAVVEFRQLTAAGKLRAPSFKGLREDKEPHECTFEQLRSSAGF